MDRTAFAVTTAFADIARDRRDYWRSKTPRERMAALEFLRSQRYPHGNPPDFAEFLRCLSDEGARYLVVGDYAVCFHGHPRYTGGMDIWVGNDADNAAKVAAALRRFGFDLPDVNPQTFMQDDVVVHMGVEPLRIEIFTHQSGVVFDECSPRAVKEILSGVETRFIGLDDLKRNKKASGRLKDLADLEELP